MGAWDAQLERCPPTQGSGFSEEPHRHMNTPSNYLPESRIVEVQGEAIVWKLSVSLQPVPG